MVAGEGGKQGPLPESEERGRMDQQVLTGAIGVVFVAVLALSYVRHRRHGGEDEGEDARPAVGIRQTMDETREYFGLSRNDAGSRCQGRRGRFSPAFDLAPLEMLADMFGPSDRKGVRGNAKERK